MHNVELSPVDSLSSLSIFREPPIGSEHFADTPCSASSLDRAVSTVDAQHAALQALLSPVLDAELTIPPFRNCGNPQPYSLHAPANHPPSLHPHNVRLSDSFSSRLSSLLDQHDFDTLIPTHHVPVTPLTSLSGSATNTNSSYGPPLHPIQQIPSSSSQYLSTHQPIDLNDLSISQQIEFDTICSDYLTMLSSPTCMDPPSKGEATSPAVSAASPPPEDEAAAKAILEVLEGTFGYVLSKSFLD